MPEIMRQHAPESTYDQQSQPPDTTESVSQPERHNASLTTFYTEQQVDITSNLKTPKQIPPLSESDKDRFLFYVDVREFDECWPWTGGTNGKPIKYRYGCFNIGGHSFYAHRVAYALKHGSIPDGMTIDHVKARGCTSKLCCNPRHLEPVTHEENLRRTKSRFCRRGHLKTGKGRNCLECSRVWVERFRQNHSAQSASTIPGTESLPDRQEEIESPSHPACADQAGHPLDGGTQC